MKEIAYSKSALKALRRMPRNTALLVRDKIVQYATAPVSLGNNVTPLVGSPYTRLRVGDWRVIMDEQGRVLNILHIRPRGGAYD